MKRILMFLHEGFADYEVNYLGSFVMTSKEDNKIDIVTPQGAVIVSKAGLKVLSDYSLSDNIDVNKYDILVLGGGRYWRSVNFTNHALKQLINSFLKEKKIIAAICDASTYLAFNGFLNDKHHSGNGKDYIKETCPNYTGTNLFIDKQCVVDLPFITANGTSGVEFGYEVCNVLDIGDKQTRDEWFAFMKKGRYFN